MIISISGRIGSGKDTVGKIIQIIEQSPHYTDETVVKMLNREIISPGFTIKKFATQLKEVVALITGCSVKDLEDQDFKNKTLPEEFWYYTEKTGSFTSSFADSKEMYPYIGFKDVNYLEMYNLHKPTYRNYLEGIGTDLFRYRLHPNIWVNSLMNQYLPVGVYTDVIEEGIKYLGSMKSDSHLPEGITPIYPKWIITDTRFPNELEAILEKRGHTVKVFRVSDPSDKNFSVPLHVSETALDEANFHWTIANDSDLLNLVRETRKVYNLILEEEFQRNQ